LTSPQKLKGLKLELCQRKTNPKNSRLCATQTVVTLWIILKINQRKSIYMPMMIEHIAAIARIEQRDGLYLTFIDPDTQIDPAISITEPTEIT